MKKLKMSVGILLLMLGGQPVQAIRYIPSSSDETTVQSQKEENEGIAAENIVIQINEEGYVVSHGDHYHHYNGKVPDDALFSEALLVPEAYELNEEDVISQVENGYIVKVKGKYGLYFPDREKVSSIRTKTEINLQALGLTPYAAKEIVELPTRLGLESNDKISIERDQQEDPVHPQKVVYLTKGYFIIMKEGHLSLYPGHPKETDLFLKGLIGEIEEGDELIVDQKNYQVYYGDNRYYVSVQNPEQIFEME